MQHRSMLAQCELNEQMPLLSDGRLPQPDNNLADNAQAMASPLRVNDADHGSISECTPPDMQQQYLETKSPQPGVAKPKQSRSDRQKRRESARAALMSFNHRRYEGTSRQAASPAKEAASSERPGRKYPSRRLCECLIDGEGLKLKLAMVVFWMTLLLLSIKINLDYHSHKLGAS